MSEALPFFEGEYQLWWQLPRGLGFQLGAWRFFFSLTEVMWGTMWDWGHEPRRTEHVLQVPSASTDRSHELVELMKNWARIHWHLCSQWPSANFLNARAWQSSTRKMRKKGQRKVGFSRFMVDLDPRIPPFALLTCDVLWCWKLELQHLLKLGRQHLQQSLQLMQQQLQQLQQQISQGKDSLEG